MGLAFKMLGNRPAAEECGARDILEGLEQGRFLPV
jgi:hypothetical protein